MATAAFRARRSSWSSPSAGASAARPLPQGDVVYNFGEGQYYYDQYGFKWENGHPLKPFKKLYDQFLANFRVVFRRDFHNEGDYAALKYSGFYFIGIKPIAA